MESGPAGCLPSAAGALDGLHQPEQGARQAARPGEDHGPVNQVFHGFLRVLASWFGSLYGRIILYIVVYIKRRNVQIYGRILCDFSMVVFSIFWHN